MVERYAPLGRGDGQQHGAFAATMTNARPRRGSFGEVENVTQGPRRKSDQYRVVPWCYDPDLPEESPTKTRLDEAFAHVTGRSYVDLRTSNDVEVVRRLDRRALMAIVFCVGGCGPDRASGERLAYVWSTPAGLLYVAELVVAHDAVPRFEQLHDDAVLMWHPQLGAYSISWTTRRALDVAWREKGWCEAPDGTSAPRQWRQQRSLVVRDLLDAEDVEHPPLRIKCSRDGEAVIDRHRLLGELARRQRERDAGEPIGLPLARVAATAR